MKKVVKKNTPAIDSTELIIAMEELEKDNGIPKDYLLESIETALVTAYKETLIQQKMLKLQWIEKLVKFMCMQKKM